MKLTEVYRTLFGKKIQPSLFGSKTKIEYITDEYDVSGVRCYAMFDDNDNVFICMDFEGGSEYAESIFDMMTMGTYKAFINSVNLIEDEKMYIIRVEDKYTDYQKKIIGVDTLVTGDEIKEYTDAQFISFCKELL